MPFWVGDLHNIGYISLNRILVDVGSSAMLKGFSHIAFSADIHLNSAPLFSNLPGGRPPWKALKDSEYGPALNKLMS